MKPLPHPHPRLGPDDNILSRDTLRHMGGLQWSTQPRALSLHNIDVRFLVEGPSTEY